MARLHHVNLGVPPDGDASEGEFLLAVGYRKVEVSEEMSGLGTRWYEADDGTQVHLSVDPDHRPAARAHTAIEVGDELDAVAERLRGAEIKFREGEIGGRRVLLCRDPAGNRWELRG